MHKIPEEDENLDVSLVISHGLQDKSNIVVGGKIIRILFEHFYNVYSLRLSQKPGCLGKLRGLNQITSRHDKILASRRA